MSWAEPADMDTLSELPPPSVSISSSKGLGMSRSGRSSKSARRVGGAASKSERRLLMEAKAGKAGIGAAIAEERQERLVAKRRARRCVRFLYYALKVVGVVACVFTSGLNLALVYMRPDLRLQNRLVRSYLVAFGVGGVLAELDTPFAKANFRALQKWWFKAPFYVFMAWLCFDPAHSRGTAWFYLELVAFAALQAMAAMAVVLNVCLREVLERSGALGKRRGKKSRRRRGAGSSSASSRGGGAGGAGVAGSTSGGLGVSSFRERDRRRPSRPLSSSPTGGYEGFLGDGGEGGDGGDNNRNAPEMVPERAMSTASSSGRLLSPTPSSTYSGFGGGGGGLARIGGSKIDSYGTVDGGGGGGGLAGGGGGLGGGISGKIKWWLDRGGAEEGGSPGGDGRAVVGGMSTPASPGSLSTARSGRTNWWEDSEGDDDGTSSLASFAQSDATSDAGSTFSGVSGRSGAGWMGGGGGRYAGRGTAPMRRAASVASSSYSRRSDSRRGGSRPDYGRASSARGGLEQRPPPLTMQSSAAGAGGGGGGAGGERGFAAVLPGEGGGGLAHVALTAQALARNSNEALPPTGRSSGFGGGGGGSNYAGSVAGSAVGGRSGGGGSLQGFGTRRSSRRPPGWEAGGPSRASSVSGDGFGGAAAVGGGGDEPAWAHGAADYDIGRTASEAGGDYDRGGEDGRHPRPGANSRRTPGTQDYTPF